MIVTIQEALSAIQNGELLIIADDERELEGDLFFPAQAVTAEKVNFLISHGKGLVCTAIRRQRAEELELPLMVPLERNTESTGVNFTVSVNATHGITTGISAYDRTETIKQLADQNSLATDFTRPGHVFPLIARDGGVLERAGHTESAVELAQLASFTPAGVICEIVGPAGHMLIGDALDAFGNYHNIKIITVKALIEYVKQERK
jgi:3,4-dihydroxy 2-butanone 4-phosphate synthase / GTP cyclohydrolase II